MAPTLPASGRRYQHARSSGPVSARARESTLALRTLSSPERRRALHGRREQTLPHLRQERRDLDAQSAC
eukprot:3891996-Alexandrium_andersonii.AAC.1